MKNKGKEESHMKRILMLGTGATIASSDLKKLLKNKNLFLTWGVRMLGASALFLFISVYSETFLGVPVIRRYSESQS